MEEEPVEREEEQPERRKVQQLETRSHHKWRRSLQ